MKKVSIKKGQPKPKKHKKGELDDISYTKQVLAFHEVIDWLEAAQERGMIRPRQEFMEALKRYRERCREECSKKPFSYG